MAVIVITGASSGIGEATAKALAARGHSLVVAARRTDRLKQLVLETDAADRILIVPADVSEPSALKALADAAGERFGHIDVWINNAGVSYPDTVPWWELAPERIENIVRVNFTAPIWSVGAALPWLKKSKNPQIINIGSVSGFVAIKGIYSATKFGIRGLTEAMRRELAKEGVSTSMVSPGYVRTELTANRDRVSNMPGPEIVVKKIVNLVEQGPRRNVVVPGYYRVPIWLNTLLPGFVDFALGRRNAATGPR
ncbi:MAG TPA: SDR family NAD(P)-dependent oxidoreductase [Beijerinckiaceae bacterium]|jgi:NAD(P)-dependent dehydrogenase (short-subunit alcohol dehydrogenase family)|nr:SDR family NAD(P)-dependent oxidoreductase [Beijerinckiaceae bacterium]